MQTREQFLKNRREGIGGSDVGAIIGVNPWKTPLDVYLEKTDPDIITEDNPAMKRGRKFEKYVLEEYEDFNQVELETNLEMVRHKDYPFLLGNIDAKIKGTNILVEAKTVGGMRWNDEITIYYKAQIAHYANITNCDYVDVAVLFGFNYKQYTYYRDYKFEEKIQQEAIDFWNNHVLKKVPPAPANEKDISKLYHTSNNCALEASDDLRSLIDKLIQLEQDNKESSNKISEIKLQIMNAMGEHESLIHHEKKLISWKSSIRRGFNTELFKEKHPDLYNEFIKVTNTRTFRIYQ